LLSRKYRREIGGDKPLPLDREQNGSGCWVRMAETAATSYDRNRFFTPTIPSHTSQPEHVSMAALGRLGQFLGLAIPAVAVLLELNHTITLGQMLVMLVAAVCSFWIGRIVEGYFRNV